jgi:hypothetical protein
MKAAVQQGREVINASSLKRNGTYSTVKFSTFTVSDLSKEKHMGSAKTATLTFRIEPSLKEAVRNAAAKEHRSITNMVAVMIRDYCGRVGVEIVEPGAPPAGSKPSAKTEKKI